jgi:ABC-type molybdenum transport system ATPase subunit/photorepair protein PhrA
MWSNPHMLIMDEPTNYLDRESLGALALAIKEWNGEDREGGRSGTGRGERVGGGER